MELDMMKMYLVGNEIAVWQKIELTQKKCTLE